MSAPPPPSPAPVPGRVPWLGWALALGAVFFVLLPMQVNALPTLLSRYAWGLQHEAETNGAVEQRMALWQEVFHLAGTGLLALGLILLHGLHQQTGALFQAARRRLRGALAFPLASALAWLAWAAARFHPSHPVLAIGMIAAVAGFGVPLWSAVGLFRLARLAPEDRHMHGLAYLATAIWVWSVAFALTELVISADA